MYKHIVKVNSKKRSHFKTNTNFFEVLKACNINIKRANNSNKNNNYYYPSFLLPQSGSFTFPSPLGLKNLQFEDFGVNLESLNFKILKINIKPEAIQIKAW